MPAINLLPEDLLPKASVVNIAKSVRQLSQFAAIALSVFALVSIGYFIFVNFRFNEANDQVISLTQSVSSLEQTEQQLALINDRLVHIRAVGFLGDSVSDLVTVANIKNNLPSDVNMVTAEVIEGNLEIILFTKSAKSFSKALNFILLVDVYDRIKLVSFGFNPVSGYVANLSLSN